MWLYVTFTWKKWNIMRTTVFFERFFFESLFYHCILITGKKTTNRCTVPSWKLNNHSALDRQNLAQIAGEWENLQHPGSKTFLVADFHLEFWQLYAPDLYTLKVKAKFLRFLPFNICRPIGATWQVVTPIWSPRATSFSECKLLVPVLFFRSVVSPHRNNRHRMRAPISC